MNKLKSILITLTAITTLTVFLTSCEKPEITTDTCNQTINLNAGWNLISFDVSPEDKSVEAVFSSLKSGNLESISGFESEARIYNSSDPEFLQTLNNITDGSAYWVKVQNSDVLTVSGICLDEGYRKPFDSGWNLMAYIPNEPQPASDYLSDLIDNGNLQFVSGFNNEFKIFDPNKPPFFNTLRDMENGLGYWVRVNNGPGKTAPNSTNIFSFINGTTNLPKGEIVNVLNEGEVIATLQVVEGNYLMTMPIYGDDLTTKYKEGISVGEVLQFSWNDQLSSVTTTYKGDYGIEKIYLEFDEAN